MTGLQAKYFASTLTANRNTKMRKRGGRKTGQQTSPTLGTTKVTNRWFAAGNETGVRSFDSTEGSDGQVNIDTNGSDD